MKTVGDEQHCARKCVLMREAGMKLQTIRRKQYLLWKRKWLGIAGMWVFLLLAMCPVKNVLARSPQEIEETSPAEIVTSQSITNYYLYDVVWGATHWAALGSGSLNEAVVLRQTGKPGRSSRPTRHVICCEWRGAAHSLSPLGEGSSSDPLMA
jgi:hypothetical protein